MNTQVQVTLATPTAPYTRDPDPFAASTSIQVSIEETLDLKYFGYNQTFNSTKSTTNSSRHDRYPSLSESLPPAYTESHRDVLPGYSPQYEPVTLAMYLFRFGFLFPPFWIMGSLILITPLRSPPSSSSSTTFTPTYHNTDEEAQPQSKTNGSEAKWTIPEKTESERKAYISHIRKTEVKWAKRCLFALFILSVLLGVGIGLGIWAMSK